MEIDKIHQAFVNLKAVKIHEDIILYVKKCAGRQYFGDYPRIVLDKNLNEDEIKNPEKWYTPLIIRAAFSWHVPSDNKENLFSLMSRFKDDIENVFINLNIDQFRAFDSVKDPYHAISIPISLPELSPLRMVRDFIEDGTTIMSVLGRYCNLLTQEQIGECVILGKINEIINKEKRNIDVLKI